MRFIDSNVSAYAFYNNPFKEKSREVINEGGVINTINLVEAFNIIEHETDREFGQRAIRGLFKANLHIVDVDINLIFDSLKKSSKYDKLKFIDLVHYITALSHGCKGIVSYDKDFEGLEIKRETPN
jgi:predicted nucleic acid-binding protein